MDIYLVGGAVRDQLLGVPVYDHDWVVVGATAESMVEQGYQPVGKDFPVFLHPKTKEEYALARTERKNGHGYKGFDFYASPDVTLEEDLRRRDLTINAMAMDEQGQLIDPFGGQQDLQQKQLRHVSAAFVEDPLRVLRVARFNARFAHLGFTLAPETLSLMQRLADSGELAHLTAERVWQELYRALGETSPQVFFQVLQQAGALAVLIPEFAAPYAEHRNPDHHPNANKALALAAKAKLSNELRLALFCFTLNINSEQLEPLLKRIKAPKECQRCCRLIANTLTQFIHWQSLSAADKLALYQQLDPVRRPEQLQWLLDAYQIHRQLTEQNADHCADLQAMLARIDSIQPADLITEGFKGKSLGEELNRRRLSLLEKPQHE